MSRYKLDAFGLEALCDCLASGGSLRATALKLQVSVGSLIEWVEADAERSARVLQARTQSAAVWDELAEEEIRKATDPFEITKARELAQHYRWRAKIVAPRYYGDKTTTEHTGKDGAPIQIAAVDMKGLSDAELDQMRTLMLKASIEKLPAPKA